MKTYICPVCNKEFNDPHIARPRKYCSRKCHYKTKEHRIDKICPVCGKEFKTTPSYPSIYCSNKCASKTRDKKVVCICEVCNKVFKLSPSAIENGQGIYCSRACKHIGQSQPRDKHYITYICPVCQTEFQKYPSQLKDNHIHFCSMKCKHAWHSIHMRGENSPSYRGGKFAYRGRNWTSQKRKALIRDGYKCVICRKDASQNGRKPDVHHIKPYREFNHNWTKANELTNLITLCRSCHKRVEHGKLPCPQPLF